MFDTPHLRAQKREYDRRRPVRATCSGSNFATCQLGWLLGWCTDAAEEDEEEEEDSVLTEPGTFGIF